MDPLCEYLGTTKNGKIYTTIQADIFIPPRSKYGQILLHCTRCRHVKRELDGPLECHKSIERVLHVPPFQEEGVYHWNPALFQDKIIRDYVQRLNNKIELFARMTKTDTKIETASAEDQPSDDIPDMFKLDTSYCETIEAAIAQALHNQKVMLHRPQLIQQYQACIGEGPFRPVVDTQRCIEALETYHPCSTTETIPLEDFYETVQEKVEFRRKSIHTDKTIKECRRDLKCLPFPDLVDAEPIPTFSEKPNCDKMTFGEALSYPITPGGEIIYTPQGTGKTSAISALSDARIVELNKMDCAPNLTNAYALRDRGFVVLTPSVRNIDHTVTVLVPDYPRFVKARLTRSTTLPSDALREYRYLLTLRSPFKYKLPKNMYVLHYLAYRDALRPHKRKYPAEHPHKSKTWGRPRRKPPEK